MFQKKKIHDVIMSSYLKPLSSQNNESNHTELGRNNEKRLIDNLLKDFQLIRNTVGIDMCNICNVGLVMHKIKIFENNRGFLSNDGIFIPSIIVVNN